MKYLMIYESNRNAPPPSPELLQKLGEYTQRMIASGTVVLTGGLVRPSKGIQIKNEGGKITVTDGPFAESKELIDGFAVVNAKNIEEAIAISKEFMGIAGEGKGEILPIYEGGPPSEK
jgi:hypothetical protein